MTVSPSCVTRHTRGCRCAARNEREPTLESFLDLLFWLVMFVLQGNNPLSESYRSIIKRRPKRRLLFVVRLLLPTS